MKLTIKLPDEKVAAMEALANSQGLTLESWLLQLAEQYAQPGSKAVLADEAMNRGRP